MSIRINNIILDIDDDINILKDKAAKKLKLSKSHIKDFKILRESIDARKKDRIKFNYTLEVSTDNEENLVKRLDDKDIKLETVKYTDEFPFGTRKMKQRPIIVGMGPAGMFAGLLMARKGYKPVIFERGQRVEERTESINSFWTTGKLNIESNVQFGEGGAGTFSDGKLTTRIKDSRCDYVLEAFVKAGAPEEILYIGKPHVGTDILKNVVKNIREEIISLGGEVRFNSRLEDLIIKDKSLKSIVVNGEEFPCENLVLAIGHSSRDTYEMLYKRGITLTAKPFAIGVRIEHLQSLIDENQYGRFAGHKRLKAADYRLSYIGEKTKRAIYSFCMCPGGEVVAAASEERRLVTNGMSYYKRDKDNANSALVVTVGPDDFGSSNPLSGMEFQRHYESLAYSLGGGNYTAPIQLVGDFLKDRVSSKLGNIIPTYKPGYEFRELKGCLPSYVIEALKEGLLNFENKIKGFAQDDAVLTGIETRTSAPLRIERNENLQSVCLKGLYPAGEGAGYAGGIMSAAVDGLKIAESIMKEWAPID
ncbi:NAD(P)/FAD-dependent oxidoreductase [Clostridium sp. SYSU_GA19001]|uniref:NAD(P)/FAD-dependent oxidoreductase n=1 Tax=Clostridium caldaquaticum TaxID=2940653 RepID=UPI0020775E14|nr:NAD(P)/FAD-dependent oxidoreductase [Clostridium caldaquaticum]MCM8710725.1 NAD(P)/FAD-dependent oxidoreductase [Clostridium caldaquaticum]